MTYVCEKSDIDLVRQRTGAGIIDIRKTLDFFNGDIEKAVNFLQDKGSAVQFFKKRNFKE